MANKENILTRKFTLVPVISEHPNWLKRFNEYINTQYLELQGKILGIEEERSRKKPNTEKYKELTRVLEKLTSKKEMYESFITDQEITKKLLSDYVYTICKNISKEESRHKNLVISKCVDTLRINGYTNLFEQEARDLFTKTFNEAVRTKDGSVSDFVSNPLAGYGVSWSNSLKACIMDDIAKKGIIDCKKGHARQFLSDGTAPFTIAKAHMSITHGYDTDYEFFEHITDKEAKIYFNLGGNGKPSILKFRFNLGANPKNKTELVSVIRKLYIGEYSLKGSSIQITGTKIFLNLSMGVPKKEIEFDKDTVIGASLGMNTAIIGVVNNNNREVLTYGTDYELTYYRNYIQSDRRELSKALANTAGGHGRNKKLKKLDIYKKRERNYVKTFNHKASRAVIDFALKNKAGVIRMPDLTKFSKTVGDDVEKKFILRNWSYYELQSMIEYKAAKYGIEVEYIDIPYINDATSDVAMAMEIAKTLKAK